MEKLGSGNTYHNIDKQTDTTTNLGRNLPCEMKAVSNVFSEGSLILNIYNCSRFLHDDIYIKDEKSQGELIHIDPHFYMQNLSFEFVVWAHLKCNQKTLAFFLRCKIQEKPEKRFCNCITKFKLVSATPEDDNNCTSINKNFFFFGSYEWAYLGSFACSQILNPENGFLKEDTISIDAYVGAFNFPFDQGGSFIKGFVKKYGSYTCAKKVVSPENQNTFFRKLLIKLKGSELLACYALRSPQAYMVEEDLLSYDGIMIKTFLSVTQRKNLRKNLQENKSCKEATFCHTVKNFSKVIDEVYSPIFYVDNLPWKIRVMRSFLNDQKSVGFFLQCNIKKDSNIWIYVAKIDLKIISVVPNIENYSRSFEGLLGFGKNNFGYHEFISWNYLLDPNNGYIKDDTVTFEVYVKSLIIESECELVSSTSVKRHFSKGDANYLTKKQKVEKESEKLIIDSVAEKERDLKDKKVSDSGTSDMQSERVSNSDDCISDMKKETDIEETLETKLVSGTNGCVSDMKSEEILEINVDSSAKKKNNSEERPEEISDLVNKPNNILVINTLGYVSNKKSGLNSSSETSPEVFKTPDPKVSASKQKKVCQFLSTSDSKNTQLEEASPYLSQSTCQQQQYIVIRKVLEQVLKTNNQNSGSNSSKEDDIDLFFRSIAKSVKELNPKLIKEAKLQTLKMLMDLQSSNPHEETFGMYM